MITIYFVAKADAAIKTTGCQLGCRVQEERLLYGATMASDESYTVSLSSVDYVPACYEWTCITLLSCREYPDTG